ncbi:MAG: hypothetical protein ACT4OI_07910 [Methanobacteriota archaeon]
MVDVKSRIPLAPGEWGDFKSRQNHEPADLRRLREEFRHAYLEGTQGGGTRDEKKLAQLEQKASMLSRPSSTSLCVTRFGAGE